VLTVLGEGGQAQQPMAKLALAQHSFLQIEH